MGISDSEQLRVLRISDTVFNSKWGIWVNSSHELRGRMEQLEDGGAMLRNVASGYDMVTATNKEQLWLPAHDLYKMKPVSILAWMREAYDAVSPLKCESLEERESLFFISVTAVGCWWMTPDLRSHGQH